MNLERSLSTDGWMKECELIYLASAAKRSLVIAELGSWKGRSTLALAENTDGVVFCVDVWEDNPLRPMYTGVRGSIFWEFQENTHEITNVIPLVTTTDLAAAAMKEIGAKFDLVFIDACHDFDSVERDILSWRPLLRDEGILCGHDFIGGYPGVAQAVKLHVPRYRLINSIWTTEPIN